MFDCNQETKKEIISYNEDIKKTQKNIRLIDSSKENSFEAKLERLRKNGLIKTLTNKINGYFDTDIKNEKEHNRKYPILSSAINDRSDTNYFSKEKIVVYTCIIGPYDKILEPHIKPDNIDYFIITDQEIAEKSLWKKIDISSFSEVNELPNVLRARYFKINAHKIFRDYKYSIYVDGNFEIFTDLTEHINRISNVGFSLFRHCQRKCVYDEIDACLLLGKGNVEQIKKYEKKLIDNNMPRNYGLVETGMLVRKHQDNLCIKLMDAWWNEIVNNIHRDQITLPYVLYSNNISIDEVATLGNNIRNDFSFNIISHS